jgi:DDE superfamily endonuclease
MQTTKNAPAKGTTGQEMKEIIEAVHLKALKKQQKDKHAFEGGVRVCWDNARPHKWAEKQLPKKSFKFVKIPPYSPDFNKVIEHRFNHIKRLFQQRVFDNPKIRTFKAAAKLLKKVVNETVTQDAVMADASTMKQTLKAIYDADGGWPPHDLL